MTLHANDAGTWKAAIPHVNDGGTWKAAKEVWANDSGTWKLVFSAVTFSPVAGTYDASGEYSVAFSITASESVAWTYSGASQAYANLASGASGGSITFNLSTAGPFIQEVITVSANGQTWNVTVTVTGNGEVG
jgi:hypothetical protein